MTWVFVVLVVLALGGIALVAAGKGAPMSEEYDDRPDATVPASGPIGAEHLRRVRFTLAFRGYRMSEVDALLDRLAREREADGAPSWAPPAPPAPLGPPPPPASQGPVAEPATGTPDDD